MNTTQAPKPAGRAASPAAAASSPDPQVDELFHAFRLMQLQHNRVVLHESEELSMGATDIRALFFIAESTEPATPKHVAEFLELSTGATTSLVDRMVDSGTLVREAHPTDRRSVILQVTPAGHAAVATVADVYRCALATVIPAESFDAMTETFTKLASALTAGSGCYEPAHA